MPQKYQVANRIPNKISIFVLKNKTTVMKYLSRVADKMLQERLETFGAVLIEGPKWTGKTTTAEQQA